MTSNAFGTRWLSFWQICWLSPNLLAEMGVFFSGRCADFHQICKHTWRKDYFCWQFYCQPNLPVDLFLLWLLYQRVCFNAIFLYFFPFKYRYTVPNAKSVLFTQISNSYLVCCNKLKFHCKTWMCCASGVTNATMAELPTLPLTPGWLSFWQMCWLPPNLLAKMWECFWQQVYWVSPNLPAEMVGGIPADFLTNCTTQKWGTISADRFTDCHQICQQK